MKHIFRITVLAFAAVLALPLGAQPLPAQLPASAQVQGNFAVEKARIARERNAAEALYKVEEKACYQKFAVTDCVNDARDKRRVVMTELHRQEVAVNDVERKRKAAERLQSIAEKSAPQKQAERKADTEKARVDAKERESRGVQKAAKAAASAPRPGSSAARQAEIDEKVKGKAADLQSRMQAAGQAVKDRQEREASAKAHKEALAKRLADRKKPPPKPLPPPPP
ncbi:hypothetical protein [Caenimonas sp. SL110]|uniref:hypothetical protein n=1 Tax=Caenimonas sp. SL110 TaxID=1450524 RepID=UPI0006528783|nr:hypothetical protein [Caenimonas sp. SL110]